LFWYSTQTFPSLLAESLPRVTIMNDDDTESVMDIEFLNSLEFTTYEEIVEIEDHKYISIYSCQVRHDGLLFITVLIDCITLVKSPKI
jgi:hypothetical protein